MAHVKMFCTAVCPYCIRAEQLLTKKGVEEIEKIRVDLDAEQFKVMLEKSGGRRTVPQIFIGDRHVGGYDDMVELDMEGELVPLLQAE
jgi:glutaredoxin 3